MERRGIMAPPIHALFATSLAIIPSSVPVPNNSGCFEDFLAQS
jgi:hypothetical protein